MYVYVCVCVWCVCVVCVCFVAVVCFSVLASCCCCDRCHGCHHPFSQHMHTHAHTHMHTRTRTTANPDSAVRERFHNILRPTSMTGRMRRVKTKTSAHMPRHALAFAALFIACRCWLLGHILHRPLFAFELTLIFFVTVFWMRLCIPLSSSNNHVTAMQDVPTITLEFDGMSKQVFLKERGREREREREVEREREQRHSQTSTHAPACTPDTPLCAIVLRSGRNTVYADAGPTAAHQYAAANLLHAHDSSQAQAAPLQAVRASAPTKRRERECVCVCVCACVSVCECV